MNHLALIRRAVRRRERHRADDDAEIRRLVCEGFAQGIPGRELADAVGVSVPRIYQIRDGRR